MTHTEQSPIFVRDTELAERSGIARTTVLRWHRDRPDFPRSYRFSAHCQRWRLSEIEAWERTRAGPGVL
jgi:predicted DNA-binding transcriptional regulator AlpA